MPIKAHLDQPQSGGENRKFERRSLLLETDGALPGGSKGNVTIHNISESGMLIETELDLAVGAQLVVDLPHDQAIPASVVWASENLYGCKFGRDIGLAALSAVQLKASPALPAQVSQRSTGDARGILLGKKLEQTRKARGLTLAQVADRLGVSKPTVWAWEKGKARPVEERWQAIADVFDVPVEELSVLDHDNGGVAELLQSSRAAIAAALGIDSGQVRILIEI